MNSQRVLIVLASALLTVVVTSEPAARTAKKPMTITISRSLFREMPDEVALAAMKPFQSLLVKGTQLSGKLDVASEGAELARRLRDGKTDIGLFEGVEFAWGQQHDTKLTPLMITVNSERCLRAAIVVRADAGIKDFADLKKQSLLMPGKSRQHCLVFLEQLCRKHQAKTHQQFFAKVGTAGLAEETLDDIVDGKASATLVDNLALACYQRRKPARADKLVVLVESIDFPSAVVVCRQGRFDVATLGKIQHSLASLDDSPTGRQVLMLWKLKAFEQPPREFEALLARINRLYPAPASYRPQDRK